MGKKGFEIGDRVRVYGVRQDELWHVSVKGKVLGSTSDSGTMAVELDTGSPNLVVVHTKQCRRLVKKVRSLQKTTSTGFVFELISKDEKGERWKDLETGLTWGPIHGDPINHYEATEKFGAALPTKEEFETAENHGIREVLDMKNKWFWSSSVFPNYAAYAYYFYGSNGGIGYYYRSGGNDAAVCVAGR